MYTKQLVFHLFEITECLISCLPKRQVQLVRPWAISYPSGAHCNELNLQFGQTSKKKKASIINFDKNKHTQEKIYIYSDSWKWNRKLVFSWKYIRAIPSETWLYKLCFVLFKSLDTKYIRNIIRTAGNVKKNRGYFKVKRTIPFYYHACNLDINSFGCSLDIASSPLSFLCLIPGSVKADCFLYFVGFFTS